MPRSPKAPMNGFSETDFDPEFLPDYDNDFITQDDLASFAAALEAPTNTPVTALNDWKPIHQKVKKSKQRRKPTRTKDEKREGFVYFLLRYPILLGVLGWISKYSRYLVLVCVSTDTDLLTFVRNSFLVRSV